MRHRCLAIMGVLAVVIAVVWLAPVPVAGQAPTAAAKTTGAVKTGTPLRTPWGEPDLQGIWNDNTQTPLQRPKEYAGKEFFTEEERAALDKKRAELPGREYRAPAGTEQDVAGAYNAVWSPPRFHTGKRTALIVDPPDGKVPPMTPGAQKRLAAEASYQRNSRLAGAPETYNTQRMNRANGPEDRSLSERCLGNTLPHLGGYFRMVQSPGVVTIYYEAGQGGGGNRIIPVDGSPHLPPHIRQWYGDARGRWEGSTLVVDTTNFTPTTDYRGSHENLHLIERFTRVDANTLNYEVTLDDPTTWTKRWTAAVFMQKNDDKLNRIFESTCHEGNYGLTGMLANTRAAEKAFAEGRGPDPATMNLAIGGAGGERDPLGGGE